MRMKNKLIALLLTTTIAAGMILTGCSGENKNNSGTGNTKEVSITNVSYDPTREFYAAYNELFQKHWQKEKGQSVKVTASHGGSGSQARSVIEGNEADVVTLALAHDITAIEDSGLIEKGWIDEFDKDSSPYTSTIVFLVRKGNEKGIHDWNDLVKKGVDVITPNPKTSGGACWNFLAAWAYEQQQDGNNEEETKEFMKKLYQNVLVLDSGARGATSTFVEKGQGDVLIAWENEAYLSIEEYPDDYEIVTPSVSILAQPSVAIVDDNADANGTQEVSRQYLEYLCSDEAQRLIGTYGYRPANAEIRKEYADKFDLTIDLWSIDDFGGWDNAYETYFDDGALFDQIYNHS